MSVQKYEFYQTSVKIEDITGNPFDTSVLCKVTKPDNTSFTVRCFYSSGNTFTARIYADVEGAWKYEIHHKDKCLVKNKFSCMPQCGIKGKVRIDPNNTSKLLYDDGSAYNMQGFEFDWIFLIDQDSHDFPKARKLIDSAVNNGFNMFVSNVVALDVEWDHLSEGRDTEYDFKNPEILPFVKTNDTIDYTMLNLEFFDKMDKIMRYLMDNNTVMHLMFYVWNKKFPWPEFGEEDDNRYFRYIVDRYQAFPNLIWDISKEALLYGNVTREIIAQKCQFVKSEDKYNTLVTVHDAGFCANNQDCIDIVSVQNWSHNLSASLSNILGKIEAKPICNIEHGGYEKGVYGDFHGAYTDPKVCLERNYISLFMGIYAVYYWQNASWSIVVWDIDSLPQEKRPHFEYYKYLKEFMDRAEFENLSPVSVNHPTRLALENSQYYYVLCPTGVSYIAGLNQVKDLDADGEFQWMNPYTNEIKNLPLTEKERVFGQQNPWAEDMAIVRMKKKEI